LVLFYSCFTREDSLTRRANTDTRDSYLYVYSIRVQ